MVVLMRPFSKPYLPVPQQIALLKSRGMAITDDGRATGDSSLLGVHQERAVFLLFAEATPGVAAGETMLTAGLLKRLPTPAKIDGAGAGCI